MSGFDDLFWLVEVVEAGTLTAAAEKHEISAAAVSKRIRLLEQRLGVRLLVRTTRHLRMTEAGEIYYQRGKALLAEFQELEDNVASTTERLCGQIRINAPMTFGQRQLVKPISEFMKQYPEVEITLHLDDRAIDIMGSDYDLVMRIGVLEDSSLVAQRVGGTAMMCCASPRYLEKAGMPIIPEDLQHHECLIYEQQSRYSSWGFERDGEITKVSVKGKLSSNNGDVLCQAACNDQGVVLMPLFILQDALNRGELVQILPEYSFELLNIYAMYPTRNYLPLKVKRLIEFLKMRLASGYL